MKQYLYLYDDFIIDQEKYAIITLDMHDKLADSESQYATTIYKHNKDDSINYNYDAYRTTYSDIEDAVKNHYEIYKKLSDKILRLDDLLK